MQVICVTSLTSPTGLWTTIFKVAGREFCSHVSNTTTSKCSATLPVMILRDRLLRAFSSDLRRSEEIDRAGERRWRKATVCVLSGHLSHFAARPLMEDLLMKTFHWPERVSLIDNILHLSEWNKQKSSDVNSEIGDDSLTGAEQLVVSAGLKWTTSGAE